MKNYPLLLTVCVACLFFLLATATSVDDDIPIIRMEPKLNVQILDTFIVLANEGKVDFEQAVIRLSFDRGESLPSDIRFQIGTIDSYAIAPAAVDTIPISEFITFDTLPFPSDTLPEWFEFEQQASGYDVYFSHEF